MKTIDTTTFLVVAAIVSLAAGAPLAPAADVVDEVLYNGIRLPADWPPRVTELERRPVVPPYLLSPPTVIPIDVGRQLFVDDFLIESTTLARTYHRPEFYDGNPILEPVRSWERTGKGPMAITHSGGVCFDARDQQFKIWYMAGYVAGGGPGFTGDRDLGPVPALR
jgi:hypothetical protein